MSFNVLSFVVGQSLAPSPERRNFYGLLGGVMGSSAVGLGVTLALANREAADTPQVLPAAALSIVSPQLLPPATDGQAYNSTLRAIGGKPPYTWMLTAGALPASGNVKLDPATGLISGTPDAGGTDDSLYQLTIQVSDSARPNPAAQSRLFLLSIAKGAAAVVNPADALKITTQQDLPPAVVGKHYSAILQATGGTPPYSWTLDGGALPGSDNITLDPGGFLLGDPDGGDVGSYPLTITVTDNAAAPASQSSLFSLKIREVMRKPR